MCDRFVCEGCVTKIVRKLVCGKLVCDKAVREGVCCETLRFVTKLCVCVGGGGERAGEGGGGREREPKSRTAHNDVGKK